MKKTLPIAISVLMLSSVAARAAQDKKNEPEQRAADILSTLGKLKDVEEQLGELKKDAPKLQAVMLEQKTTSEELQKQSAALLAKLAAINERAEQNKKWYTSLMIRCPRTTKKESLRASCIEEIVEFQRTQSAIDYDRVEFDKERKALLKALDSLMAAAGETGRQMDHNMASHLALEKAKSSLQQELGRLIKEVSTCVKGLTGSFTCERLKLECGNVQFDGSDQNLKEHILKDSQGKSCSSKKVGAERVAP